MGRVILLISFMAAAFGVALGNKHYLFAPQIIREGVDETVVLSLHGVNAANGAVRVVASVNLGGIRNFQYDNVDPNKPIKMKIRYDKPDGAPETNKRQYVALTVIVNQNNKEIYRTTLRMRVVENSGYLYVQTDRPIYRPQEIVKYRVAALTNGYTPERERKVKVVIRIPLENVGISEKEYTMSNNQKFIEDTFALPEYPVYGIWSVEARYIDQKVVKWSTREFDVRPYVLPTFNVRVEPDHPFILVKPDMIGEHITGVITAEYSYGKKIYGNYYVTAKLLRPGSQKPVSFYQFPDQGKQARIQKGQAKFRIKTTTVLNALIGVDDGGFDLLKEEGATVVIEVSVTGFDDGTIESAKSRSLGFVDSPYIIKIDRMSKYYTPGTSFEIKADVVDSVTQRPLKKIPVTLTGPFSCGNKACPNGQCCVDNACVICEAINLETDDNGQINYNENMDGNPVPRTYNIRTRSLAIVPENEASLTFLLLPYQSKSGSVLQLSATKKIAEVGDNAFQIELRYKTTPAEFRYMISARGSIVAVGSDKPKANTIQHTMKISITSKMVPSFRIFVYYVLNGEMVSNSLWVDVLDACAREIKVTVPKEVLPGAQVEVKYEGSPNAMIGVSAVDRAAYFLYGDSRLTRHKVFEGLNEYDQGCVREGGRNAQHVFEEGGFQVVTNGAPYPAKEDFTKNCNHPSRKKRQAEAEDNSVEKDWRSDDCFTDSLIPTNGNDTCLERSNIVRDNHGIDCAEAFMKGCLQQEYERNFAKSSAKSAEGSAAHKKALATTRSNFEESMLWSTEFLNPLGLLTLPLIARHSITTFEFDTVSMHPEHGFCVAETQNMTVFKKVFIQLHVPYSLKRREQAEIRATVFNYAKESREVRLSIKMGKDICSHYPEEKFTEVARLKIRPNSAVGVNFVVLPLRIPKNDKVEIEAKAFSKDSEILDHIKRSILVEPEGEIREIRGTRTFDLRKKASEEFKFELRFPENFVPGTRQCWLYPFSNFMGPIIEFDPVTKQPKNDVKNIIRMPGGCGEQTMLSMGPNVYAHKYMSSVGKMLPGSAEEKGSIEKMKSGFANELRYRCNCNPKVWSVFPRAAPSVWLNAYVNKVFAQAKQFHTTMDTSPICTSVSWLTTQQAADGSFNTGGRVIHQEMHGAVGSKLTLTAYVMMSLVESVSLCNQHVKAVEEAIFKATQYLVGQKENPQMEQPYAIALVAYAMTVSDVMHEYSVEMRAKLRSKIILSPDNRLAFLKGAPLAKIQGTGTHAYWYQRKPLAIDIEATGYGLLALLFEAGATGPTQEMFDLTRKIVLWLIEQRDENGGFTTTQDTVVGLHALADYMIWSSTAEPDQNEVDIDVTITSPEGTEYFDPPLRFLLDKTNENVTQPIPVGPNAIAKGILNVRTQGDGEGTISYRCVYRTLIDEEACHFELAVSLVEHENRQIGRANPDAPIKLKMVIRVSKPNGDAAGQSIIEITLISGYQPDEESLKRLSQEEYLDGVIERYEIANQKVVLYLKEITEKPINIPFLLTREINVKHPDPATVSVYYYYEPSIRCTEFYALPNNIPQLRTTPCNDEKGYGGEDMCKCAEGGCLKCRTRAEQLTKTMCIPGMKDKCKLCKGAESDCFNMTKVACESSYVYLVNLTKSVKDTTGVFVNFEARIETLYKRGPDAAAKSNELRKFVTRTDCFHGCRDEALASGDKEGDSKGELFTEESSTFVIFGNEFENSIDKNGDDDPRYMLKEGDHAERVYSTEKCKAAKDLVDGMCKKKKKKTKRQKAKCQKNKAINQSCLNLRLLRRMLIRGCDTQ